MVGREASAASLRPMTRVGWAIDRHKKGAGRGLIRGVVEVNIRSPLSTMAVMAICIACAFGCSKNEEPSMPAAGPPVPPALPEGGGNGLNLLLLTVDTLRADHIGAYGYGPPTSPAIDRLAESGTLFERAFAQRGLTWPSLASLMTSRYPVQHGVRMNGVPMSASETTLAEILQAKGYASAAFLAGNAGDQYWEGFDRVVVAEDPEIARRAIRWLKQNDDKRFFLWLHFWGPHKPYTPPEEYEKRFSPNYSGPFNGTIHHTNAITLHQKELDASDLAHLIGLYDALIALTDDLLEEVLESLESLGLAEKTLVVFTSDHGEDLYDHNKYFYHLASVYDSSLHVPLIFRLPGTVPAGTRVSTIVETIDIAPSIVNLLGFSEAPRFEGTSLVPFFRGETLDLGPAFAEWQDWILTVRTDGYRYVLNPMGGEPPWIPFQEVSTLKKQDSYRDMIATKLLDPGIEQLFYRIEEIELYDMDRNTLRTVDDLGEYSSQISEFNRLLQDWQRTYGWELLGGIDEDIDPDVQERLEALGYVF